jgi:gliding motility-associated-like protein
MDTVTLTLSNGLLPGNYSVVMKSGNDQNTIMDNCDNQVHVGMSLPFVIAPPQPTPFDSLTPPGCAPDMLELVFKNKIKCTSIASNGSDFQVTGSTPIAVLAASGNCDADGLTDIIKVRLSGPILNDGNYQVRLLNGVDGNTIIDECGLVTPLSAPLPFTTRDTVSADFDYATRLGCLEDTVDLIYIDKNGVDRWTWVFGDGDTSHLQYPQKRYSVFGDKPIQLIVSNGVCSDTTTEIVPLDNAIEAAFEAPNILCPTDGAAFRNNTKGHVVSWDWDFGDNAGSTDEVPQDHFYPVIGMERKYNIVLVITNELGCKDTATQLIDVLKSCYIAVPSAFTPNGDGMNDYLYPLNAYKADNMEFKIYNRWGQLLFTSRDWLSKWDGRVGGQPAPSGTLVWTLQYTDRDTGKKFFQKGTTLLIR